MKFRSKIFIHFFTFAFVPNIVILLFLLLLYQQDVEKLIFSKGANPSYSLLYDRNTQQIIRSEFPYPLQDTLKRYLPFDKKERVTFHARGGDHYYRFVCIGASQSLCEIISVDSISWIHRLGLTNIFLSLIGMNLIIIFLTAVFLSRAVTAPIRKIVDWINSGSTKKLNKKFNIAEMDLLSSRLENAIEKERTYIEAQKLAAVGKMAQKVAHDMKNPLSAMQTTLGFFSKTKPDDPKYSEYLNLFHLSASRLMKIADQLLKGATEETENSLFSLHQLLDELIGEYKGQEAYQDIRFVKEYKDKAIFLSGDPIKLQQAFSNLIKNAIEAMDFKGIIIVTVASHDNWVQVTIQDQGCGIDQEKLEKVLQGGYTDGKENGHGIGLTIVQDAVKEFGGRLEATSSPNKGSSFSILLPLPVADTTNSKEKESITDLTIQTSEKGIVVIDDEASMREQWRLLLNEYGVGTQLIESFESLKEKITEGFDARTYIVDYHFEGKQYNGMDIIHYLIGKGASNIILCTAEYWKPLLREEARRLNIKLCPKPLPNIHVKRSTDAINGGYHVLVIDDDPLIGITWTSLQSEMKIGRLDFYPNLEAVIKDRQLDLPSIDFAFVDKNIDGSQYALNDSVQYLRDKRVKKIILVSGEIPETCEIHSVEGSDHVATTKVPPTLKNFI